MEWSHSQVWRYRPWKKARQGFICGVVGWGGGVRAQLSIGICPGLVLCVLTFVLLSVPPVNKDHICSPHPHLWKGTIVIENWKKKKKPKWPPLAEWSERPAQLKRQISETKQTNPVYSGMKSFYYILKYWWFFFSLPVFFSTLLTFSPLWRSLLRAVWCHPLAGLARLLQRLAQLWVGHWGRARKLHQDQLWQVCKKKNSFKHI